MNPREKMRICAHSHDIDIYEMHLTAAEALSEQQDGTCAIAIDRGKIKSVADETVKLAHELGHCIRGAFYSEHTHLETRGRCEHKANVWAARRLIPWSQLKAAVLSGITEPWELAEHFEVTEVFLRWTLEYYLERKLYSFN